MCPPKEHKLHSVQQGVGHVHQHQAMVAVCCRCVVKREDAVNLKLSFDVIGGGDGAKWPVAFGNYLDSLKQLNHENQQLRHMLQAINSSRFHQEVHQHLCLDEARVCFTSSADLSATCNALLREK